MKYSIIYIALIGLLAIDLLLFSSLFLTSGMSINTARTYMFSFFAIGLAIICLCGIKVYNIATENLVT